jgi:hypothetical protein
MRERTARAVVANVSVALVACGGDEEEADPRVAYCQAVVEAAAAARAVEALTTESGVGGALLPTTTVG